MSLGLPYGMIPIELLVQGEMPRPGNAQTQAKGLMKYGRTSRACCKYESRKLQVVGDRVPRKSLDPDSCVGRTQKSSTNNRKFCLCSLALSRIWSFGDKSYTPGTRP